MIRVAIVDDQALFRLGLRTLLARQNDSEIVAEATNGAEAVVAVANHRPDVVLMDVRERDVFRALGEASSNRESADRLCVAEGTVRNHVTSILANLRLKSRMQAALLANGVRCAEE